MNLRLRPTLQPLLRFDLRRKLPVRPAVFVGPRAPESMPPWMTTGRSRPRYFDGRFLASRDLERDQLYVAARQAEYLRAAGAGVIHGLEVTRRDDALVVEAGAAITPGGQLVVVREHIELAVGDAAAIQRLDADLGLQAAPRDPGRRGSGVYVLMARPIEYTANPIGLYPASIETRRAPEDGEIVEAVAFTLVPFRDAAIDVEPTRQRAALARRVFVERAEVGAAVEAVPLAMVQLERGFVRWVDPWLARRELGDAYDGAGAQRRGPRSLAEAQVQQYHHYLADRTRARRDTNQPALFAASDELAALPPVGRYPRAALDLATRTDRFFPPTMPLTFQIVPVDELPVIVDELLALPPIDLQAGATALATAPVAVLCGVPRTVCETLPAVRRRFALSPATRPPPATPPPVPAIDVETAVFYFGRQRRAIGDTEDGIRTIERQAVG
jgi:hypothetical protein